MLSKKDEIVIANSDATVCVAKKPNPIKCLLSFAPDNNEEVIISLIHRRVPCLLRMLPGSRRGRTINPAMLI